ncbi:hypothetical protein J7Y59_005041 [Serratia marcescens]
MISIVILLIPYRIARFERHQKPLYWDETLLVRMTLYSHPTPDFVAVKDKATVRLNVSIGGGGVELLATGPKWYDTRAEQGGGGAIDLTMHLFRLPFVDAVKRLSP